MDLLRFADILRRGQAANPRVTRRKAMLATLIVLTFVCMWAWPTSALTYGAMLATVAIVVFEVDKRGEP